MDVGLTPREEPGLAFGDELPLVSIIVPVRNEEGFIGRCIQALAAQDYPHDRMEVFVLDGASTDFTAYETQHAAEGAGLTVFYAPNPKQTTASGFNLGLTLAHGDVIVKVDGHTRVEPNFLSASVRALIESGADAVGGPIRTRGFGKVGRAIALAMSSPFGIGDSAFRHAQSEALLTDSVPFGAYRRSVFERLGGLDETIDKGEDDEFNYRLVDSGGRILLTPAISTVYFVRDSFAGLWSQYFGYGLAKASVLRRHPRRLRPRHLVPSAFVMTLLSGGLLGLLDRRFALLAALAGAAYAIANAAATLRVARDANQKEAPYVAGAFAVIHVAAGIGFIAGVIRNLLRPRGRDV